MFDRERLHGEVVDEEVDLVRRGVQVEPAVDLETLDEDVIPRKEREKHLELKDASLDQKLVEMSGDGKDLTSMVDLMHPARASQQLQLHGYASILLM